MGGAKCEVATVCDVGCDKAATKPLNGLFYYWTTLNLYTSDTAYEGDKFSLTSKAKNRSRPPTPEQAARGGVRVAPRPRRVAQRRRALSSRASSPLRLYACRAHG